MKNTFHSLLLFTAGSLYCVSIFQKQKSYIFLAVYSLKVSMNIDKKKYSEEINRYKR